MDDRTLPNRNGHVVAHGDEDWTPISKKLMGDCGEWTWEVPRLWRMLTDPGGPTQPPPVPSSHGCDADRLDRRIAYWAPLLTLTFGVLGWARPAVGVQRWMAAGRPADDVPVSVLARWWGAEARVLADWELRTSALSDLGHDVAIHTGTLLGPEETKPGQQPASAHSYVFTGGGDPLHLAWHAKVHLLGSDGEPGNPTARIMHDPPDGPHREASLVLHRYAGWYADLVRLGSDLPVRRDGRSWRVHVTVAPLGYLGNYRRSKVTGRWFSGRHRWHMLG